MRELWDTVVYFFVTESVCDHRGNPRKLVLSENVEMFSWATDRLVINISDKNLKAKTTWDHEKYQRYRSVIDTKTKFDLKDEDFIIISDIDEIPRPAAIKEMAEEGGKFTLHMPMYYYYLNLYVQDWYHPKALSVKYLEDPNDIRTGGLDKDFHIAYNSGWHFSYLGSEEQIKYKIKTFAHDEMDTELFTDIEHIRSSIDSKSDLFDRFGNSSFTKLEINESWPEYVVNNKEKYKQYILN